MMLSRSSASRKAASTLQNALEKGPIVFRRTVSVRSESARRPSSTEHGDAAGRQQDFSATIASISEAQKQKKSLERDFFVSVLETSATKRDAKAYLKTYTPILQNTDARDNKTGRRGTSTETEPIVDALTTTGVVTRQQLFATAAGEDGQPSKEGSLPHVAIVKLRDPQSLDDQTLDGVAKTLTQLRALGLQQVVVVDTEPVAVAGAGANWLATLSRQAARVAAAIDKYGEPGTRIVDSLMALTPTTTPAAQQTLSPLARNAMVVDNEETLLAPLGLGEIPIVPAVATDVATQALRPAPANELVFALTRKLSGLQFDEEAPFQTTTAAAAEEGGGRPEKLALVERIIVLDPLGGIPNKARPNSAHVFLNLDQEFGAVRDDLLRSGAAATSTADARTTVDTGELARVLGKKHAANLELARNCLALLPSTSSVLITTPQEAAHEQSRPYTVAAGKSHATEEARAEERQGGVSTVERPWSLVGSVGTRRQKNPLIHNLLTDRPVYSSSLPAGRAPTGSESTSSGGAMIASPTTLAKRGMPLTVYPDPRRGPWQPPTTTAGRSALRLTDTCVDLPRLVHLIEDSFGRRLDVRHYLDRVNDKIAGVIVAGEYEGGAILTWEAPAGMSYEEARTQGRLVPYLDKFAVLKRSQGAGGVADIVFNAMVRSCFPDGVCWRSRKDNPVNRWYFERSVGTWKLKDANWTMFWTTPGLDANVPLLQDYESVCRNVPPSWADKMQVVD